MVFCGVEEHTCKNLSLKSVILLQTLVLYKQGKKNNENTEETFTKVEEGFRVCSAAIQSLVEKLERPIIFSGICHK